MPTIPIPRLIIGALLLTVFMVFVLGRLPQSEPAQIQPAHAVGSETSATRPVPQSAKKQTVVDHYYGDPVLKETYFCDLALTLRERCERLPRDAESLEFCLKAIGYYTNSRYCGYRP